MAVKAACSRRGRWPHRYTQEMYDAYLKSLTLSPTEAKAYYKKLEEDVQPLLNTMLQWPLPEPTNFTDTVTNGCEGDDVVRPALLTGIDAPVMVIVPFNKGMKSYALPGHVEAHVFCVREEEDGVFVIDWIELERVCKRCSHAFVRIMSSKHLGGFGFLPQRDTSQLLALWYPKCMPSVDAIGLGLAHNDAAALQHGELLTARTQNKAHSENVQTGIERVLLRASTVACQMSFSSFSGLVSSWCTEEDVEMWPLRSDVRYVRMPDVIRTRSDQLERMEEAAAAMVKGEPLN